MLNILYIDEHFCVIDKPANSVVHKTRGAEGSLILLQSLRDQINKYIYPVHRLDRPSSGCLCFSFSSEIAHILHQELSVGDSVKKYLGLCRKGLTDKGELNRDLSDKNKVKKTAITKYQLLEEFKEVSLMEFQIITGRKHQIRRHLAHEAKHLVGDVNYGKSWLNNKFREHYNYHKIFLHCNFLSLIHPISRERVNIYCKLTNESELLLEKLREELRQP